MGFMLTTVLSRFEQRKRNGSPREHDFATRLLEKLYNAAESCGDRTLWLDIEEVTIEALFKDWRIHIDLLDLAAGGAALHWFRTEELSNR